MRTSKQILIGGFAGGSALFVWSVIAWTMLPFEGSVMRPLSSESAVVKVLQETSTAEGIYVIPGPLAHGAPTDPEVEAREAKLRSGPIAVLFYDPKGTSPNRMFWPLARGIAFCFLAATFATLALARARLSSWTSRVGFVLALGLFAWVLGPGTQWVWFNYPTEYLLASLADTAAGWLLVGIVQAGIVRPSFSPAGEPRRRRDDQV